MALKMCLWKHYLETASSQTICWWQFLKRGDDVDDVARWKKSEKLHITMIMAIQLVHWLPGARNMLCRCFSAARKQDYSRRFFFSCSNRWFSFLFIFLFLNQKRQEIKKPSSCVVYNLEIDIYLRRSKTELANKSTVRVRLHVGVCAITNISDDDSSSNGTETRWLDCRVGELVQKKNYLLCKSACSTVWRNFHDFALVRRRRNKRSFSNNGSCVSSSFFHFSPKSSFYWFAFPCYITRMQKRVAVREGWVRFRVCVWVSALLW